MICGDVIQPVGRMNLELSDESAVNLFLGTDDIPKEVKEYVEELVKRNELDENNNLTVTYFSPLLLDGNSYTNTGSYNGMSMRTDGIYIENMPTGFFFSVNGSKAKERAAAIDFVSTRFPGIFCILSNPEIRRFIALYIDLIGAVTLSCISIAVFIVFPIITTPYFFLLFFLLIFFISS